MGRVINQNASASRVLRDVAMTLAVAEATGAETFEDADRYLGDVVVRATEIEGLIEDQEALVLRQRAQLQAGNERCNDLVHRIRDEFFNLAGRASRDPILGLVFPGGARHYASFTARQKPLALELLARALETHRHRRVSDDDVARMAGELRAEGAAMTAIIDQLTPALVEARVLQAQRTATARLARRQLAALKRFWIAEGLSEAEIHEVIPNRTASRRGATDDGTTDPLDDDLSELDETDDPSLIDDALPEDPVTDDEPADQADAAK